MTVDEFLERLEGVRPSGSGFVAFCPAHEDTNTQSLSVTEGEDAKIVLKCHTGCKVPEIVKAMGLELKDLFASTKHAITGEPEAVYLYTDEHGSTLYEQVRMPGKKFRQRHLDPSNQDAKPDGYVYNLDGVRRVLYRLPELIVARAANRPVWIVEGEKDADSMAAAGAVATNGKNFRSEHCAYFAGSNVTVVADRDDVGRKLAVKIKDMLAPFAANVRIVQAKEGKDATDHLEAGHGLDDFGPIRQGPRRGIVTSLQLAEGAMEALDKNELDQPGYQMLDNCPITFRNGRMYALGAYSSDGKTRLACQIARRLASLYHLRVGYFTLEMPETDLRNILIQHKGIPLRVLEEPWTLRSQPEFLAIYHEAVAEIAEWNLDIAFNTKTNADYIVQTALDREHEFVIVDHIHRLSWGGDRGKLEAEVQNLTNLALENNIPVLLLCQLRKASRGKDMVAFPKPTVQEFRETSVIENDAAMALGLWRQRDQTGMKYVGGSDITILKNRYTTGRHDASGTFFLPSFDITTQLFTVGGHAHVENTGIVDAVYTTEEEEEFDDQPDWGSIYD